MCRGSNMHVKRDTFMVMVLDKCHSCFGAVFCLPIDFCLNFIFKNINFYSYNKVIWFYVLDIASGSCQSQNFLCKFLTMSFLIFRWVITCHCFWNHWAVMPIELRLKMVTCVHLHLCPWSHTRTYIANFVLGVFGKYCPSQIFSIFLHNEVIPKYYLW